MSSSPGATPSEATLREHAELLAGGGLLAKSEIEWRAKVLAKAFLSARSETRQSEPVAWAVVTSDGDPREANSIHWPATCRHTADGDAKQAAQNWADRHGYSIVPLYAAPQMPAESGVLNQSAVAAPFAASATRLTGWQRFPGYFSACGALGRDGVRVDGVSFIFYQLKDDDGIVALPLSESEAIRAAE